MNLSNANLALLPDAIQRPSYDRTKLRAGIVHIGLGNFHRAHQSWYLHRLMQQGRNHDWAIVGAGIRAYDAKLRESLLAQDCLTTLIELDPSSVSAEVVGSMIDYLPVEAGNRPLIERMAEPDIRIVSLTVTEGGYFIDPATKGFDAQHPDILHDAAHPESPRTAFGAMIAALKLRRAREIGPFTGQSCDNLQGNGDILRQTLVCLARLSDPALAEWIDSQCTFPNSMVDCIVPATGAHEREQAQELGITDPVVVTHENFRQWVIEDKFCAGRPDWDQVGATFSDNVHGYEMQKIRILNAGHQVIVNAAEVLHIDTIADIMQHPGILAFFRKLQTEEILPHVVPVPGMTPSQYVDLIESRFANTAIVDTTRRVAFDGSSRHPGMVLPTVRDGLANDIPVNGLALAEAAWARMCAGVREDGSHIQANDPIWDELQETAQRAKDDPLQWLAMRRIYGDLAEQPRFAQAFSYWLTLIWEQGMSAALEHYCAKH